MPNGEVVRAFTKLEQDLHRLKAAQDHPNIVVVIRHEDYVEVTLHSHYEWAKEYAIRYVEDLLDQAVPNLDFLRMLEDEMETTLGLVVDFFQCEMDHGKGRML